MAFQKISTSGLKLRMETCQLSYGLGFRVEFYNLQKSTLHVMPYVGEAVPMDYPIRPALGQDL